MANASTAPRAGSDAEGASTLAPRLRAADQLRTYVNTVDWSHMTYRRQQILEAFVELASTIGYESVTMRALGERVGVKAPSIYRHFDGRDTIVAEAYRWHFYRFASALLEAVDRAGDVEEYWNALIGVHVRRQLESPENDMWDILLAGDRIAGFLPSDMRDEYRAWLRLYEQMHEAAVRELGYGSTDVGKFAKIVVKIFDTVGEWCDWDGTERGMQLCIAQAIAISRALLAVDVDGAPAGAGAKARPLRRLPI
ncbi:TetR/AcrR family transcriptional regulator [Mycolicibacterium sp. P9-64]|uniref:TetR/AcrR family transcriptional regulator n=1 Tax=Mycolicibacterium sp. P9-64 TaxID=2024612 RepID=UPI001565B6B2|nr:TetR/AcrR family transcriptional regulator [Mycolicibacterium sp. P9-64]